MIVWRLGPMALGPMGVDGAGALRAVCLKPKDRDVADVVRSAQCRPAPTYPRGRGFKSRARRFCQRIPASDIGTTELGFKLPPDAQQRSSAPSRISWSSVAL